MLNINRVFKNGVCEEGFGKYYVGLLYLLAVFAFWIELLKFSCLKGLIIQLLQEKS
jgi:hypothetical protein